MAAAKELAEKAVIDTGRGTARDEALGTVSENVKGTAPEAATTGAKTTKEHAVITRLTGKESAEMLRAKIGRRVGQLEGEMAKQTAPSTHATKRGGSTTQRIEASATTETEKSQLVQTERVMRVSATEPRDKHQKSDEP